MSGQTLYLCVRMIPACYWPVHYVETRPAVRPASWQMHIPYTASFAADLQGEIPAFLYSIEMPCSSVWLCKYSVNPGLNV